MGGQTGIPVWVHSIIVFAIGSVIVNPSERWSLVAYGQATGGGGDALLWFLTVLAGLFLVFYGIPLYDAAKKGDGFYGHVIIASAAFLFVLFMIIKMGLMIFDAWQDWAWAAMVWVSIITGLGKWEAAGAEG